LAAWVRRHQRAVGIGSVVAAVALLGIAIGLGWAIYNGGREPAQLETPSASADSSSRPEASISATDGPIPSSGPSLSPRPPWPPAPVGDTFLYSTIWAVSTVDNLNIRTGPGTEHRVIGQLDAGDLVLVIECCEGGPDISWAHVATDGAIGYVSEGLEGQPWLLSTPTPWKSFATRLAGVASNGSAYLAYGNTGAFDYWPYEGGQASLLVVSDDGASWTELEEGARPYGSVTDVAGGPGGWVALSSGYPDVHLASFSADGRTWEDLHDQPYGGAGAVAFGPGGWVVVSGVSAMRSADGRSWSEPVAFAAGPLGGMRLDRLESSDAGYIAFARGGLDAGGLWASPDGARWVPVHFGTDPAWIADVELVGTKLLVVLRAGAGAGTDPYAEGRSILLRGTMATSGAVSWDAPVVPFDDGRLVDSISQGSDGLLALGWDAEALLPVAWESADGTSWQRLSTSEGLLGGSVGPEPVWGAGGWVGLGSSPDGAGQQLWRSADGTSWSPTGDPIMVRERPPCPPPGEVSTLVLMYLEPFAGECFGQTSLTVRGWVPAIDGLGGCCFPVTEPGWLAGTYPGGYLMPGRGEALAFEDVRGRFVQEWDLFRVYLPPGLTAGSLQQESWVEIVGHYRDDAAGTCRSIPLAMYAPHSLESLVAVRRECRQRFVGESITAVDGP
jgi:hypothetical protein